MPRGPSRQWRQLAEHTTQALPYVRAAIQCGHDTELSITEVAENDALNFQRGLYNAAKLLRVSLHCRSHRQKDGSFTLTYAVHDKRDGRAYVLAKHGGDRTQWPYNPRRRPPAAAQDTEVS